MAGRRHLCAYSEGIGVNRPGAFAEFMILPSANLWLHHEGIDLDVASLFDLFGNAVHTALQFDLLGEDMLTPAQVQLAQWPPPCAATRVRVMSSSLT